MEKKFKMGKDMEFWTKWHTVTDVFLSHLSTGER